MSSPPAVPESVFVRGPVWPLFAGVGLALALGSFEGAGVQAIFPYVGGGLATSSDHALWTLTYFVVHWSLGIALMPWSVRRFGERRVFQGAVVLAAVGTLLAALTHGLGVMLIARAAEGLGAGLLVPLSQSVFLRATPKARHGLVTVLWSNAMLLPFFVGPGIGGWLAVHWGFRFVFWVALGPWLVALGLGSHGLRAARGPDPATPPFDTAGFVLLYAGLMALQVVLDQGEQHGWWGSPFIREFALFAALFLGLFALRERGTAHPLLQFQYLRRRNYVLGLLLLSLGWALFMGWASILPLWAEEDLGYNGLWGGLLLVPVGLGALPLSIVLDRLRGLVGLRRLSALSFLLFAGAYGTLSLHTHSAMAALFRPLVMLGVGVGILFVPLTLIIMSEISAGAIAAAATTANFIRVFSANIGVTALSVYWSRGSARATVALSGELSRYAQAPVIHGAALADYLGVEAHTVSLDNLLRLSMWLCLGAALLAWFFLIPPRSLVPTPVSGRVEEAELEAGGP